MKEFRHFNALKMAEIMNRLDFFRTVTAEEKRNLIENNLIKVRGYVAGEQLIEVGRQGDEFFMLMSGKLDVLTSAQKKVAELKPGQFFGEVAFILNERRTATIVAQDNVVVMVLDHTTLKLMPVNLRDKIKDKLISGLVKRVAELNGQLEKFID
jgi:CRP-like cAMP-binding protein